MVHTSSWITSFFVLGAAQRGSTTGLVRFKFHHRAAAFMRPAVTSIRLHHHVRGKLMMTGRRSSSRPHTRRQNSVPPEEQIDSMDGSNRSPMHGKWRGAGGRINAMAGAGATMLTLLLMVSRPGFADSSANGPQDAAAAAAAVAVATGDALGGAGPSAVAAGEMGARLDAPAAISFGAVVVAFAFLRTRIGNAIKARTARREYEQVLISTEKRRLAGEADDEEVRFVAERMSQLMKEELEAKTLEIFGVPFNLVLPDGGNDSPPRSGGGRQASGAGPLEARELSGFPSRGELGIRDAIQQKNEADLRDGKARQEEMTPAATLKVAVLWLVLISQLWLLTVLSNDPMGPPSSAFFRD